MQKPEGCISPDTDGFELRLFQNKIEGLFIRSHRKTLLTRGLS